MLIVYGRVLIIKYTYIVIEMNELKRRFIGSIVLVYLPATAYKVNYAMNLNGKLTLSRGS